MPALRTMLCHLTPSHNLLHRITRLHLVRPSQCPQNALLPDQTASHLINSLIASFYQTVQLFHGYLRLTDIH